VEDDAAARGWGGCWAGGRVGAGGGRANGRVRASGRRANGRVGRGRAATSLINPDVVHIHVQRELRLNRVHRRESAAQGQVHDQMERFAELLQRGRRGINQVRLVTIEGPADLAGRPLDGVDVEGIDVAGIVSRHVVGILAGRPREYARAQVPEDVVIDGRLGVFVLHDIHFAPTGPVGGHDVVIRNRRGVVTGGRVVAYVAHHPERRPRTVGIRHLDAGFDFAVLD